MMSPLSNRSTNDLLAPVGPTPTRSVPDLLAPVGPRPTHEYELPDLMTPVGPTSVRNQPDLLTPVGPTSLRNQPDMLEPVGPLPIRNAPEFPTPVGPKPTKGIDLPAPKGFFDEAPPPAPAHTLGSVDAFDDDLEMVPPGEYHPQIEPGFRDHSHAGPIPSGFSMDDLDLGGEQAAPAAADDESAGYGEVDLPRPSDDGLVSFSAPTGRTSVGARPVGIELVDAPKKKLGTLAGDDPATDQPATKIRRGPRTIPKGLIVGLVALAALGGGAYYVYTSIELTVFGIMTVPAQDRQAQIARGLVETRKLLGSSDAGHWGRAAETAERVVKLDKLANEAKALAAQAYAARAIEEGRDLKADKDKADVLLADVLKTGGRGREVDKAVALRSVLDVGKADEATASLAKVASTAPTDGDAALFAGWAALEARAYDKAAAQFHAALKITPDRHPALIGLGRAELGLGDTVEAKRAFQGVFDKYPNRKDYAAWLQLTELETTPRDRTGKREKALAVLVESAPERETAHPRDRARGYTLYGDEAMAAGHWGPAAERYRHALELDPRNVDALVGTALAAVEQRTHEGGAANMADARKALEAALTIDAKNVGAMVGLVRIDLLEGRADDAQRYATSAVAAGEKNATVHFWNGKVLEDPIINDLSGAEKSYQRAIDLAPDDYGAYVALSQLYLGRARTAEKLLKKADAKAWTDKAVAVLAPIAEAAKTDKEMANILGSAYFGARDLVHSEQWFRVGLQLDAGFIEARVNLASSLEAQAKLAEATSEWARAYHDAPRREDIALGLARSYEKGRNFAAAEKIYAALLSTDGGNVPTARATAASGLYYARRDQIDLARKQGATVAAIDPGNPAALFLQGVGFMADKKPGDAVRLFHDAIALEPQAQYWETLGRLLYDQKAYSEARASFEQALKIDANYSPALLGLARFLLAQRNWVQAIPILQQAQALDPQTAEIPIGLGDAFSHVSGKGGEAKGAYQDALKINPQDGQTHFKLAMVYSDEGEGTQSVSHFNEAILYGPKDADWYPTAYERLGYIYRNVLRRKPEMCQTFRRFIEVAKPNDTHIKDIKRELAGCPN